VAVGCTAPGLSDVASGVSDGRPVEVNFCTDGGPVTVIVTGVDRTDFNVVTHIDDKGLTGIYIEFLAPADGTPVVTDLDVADCYYLRFDFFGPGTDRAFRWSVKW
jgi:hypothetical protein